MSAEAETDYGGMEELEEWKDATETASTASSSDGVQKSELAISTALTLPLQTLYFSHEELASLPADLRTALASSNTDAVFPLRIVSERLKGIAFQLWPAAKVFAAFMLRMQHDQTAATPIVPQYGRAAAAAAAATVAAESTTVAASAISSSASVPSAPFWPGLRVLELGAGCGLNGMLAAALGAKVTLTDMESVVGHMNANVEQNFGPGNIDSIPGIDAASMAAARRILRGRLSISALEWGASLPAGIQAGDFDVLLLSDCVYWEDLFPLLVSTLRSLSISGTRIFLCQTPRRPKVEKRFYNMAQKHFTLTLIQSVPATEESGERRDVKLYELRKK